MSVPEGLSAAVGPGSTLLLAPSVSDAGDEACQRLAATAGADALLIVTLTGTPDGWLDRWDRAVGADRRPADVVFVTADGGFGPDDSPAGVTVESVSSPGDLTGLGMRISAAIQRWHEADRRVACCFDSLTTLLQFGERHSVFRFLNLVTTRLGAIDAAAHFHLDPAAVDERTLSTLSAAVRRVARHEDGEWTVRGG
jgi:hypothetical protein